MSPLTARTVVGTPSQPPPPPLPIQRTSIAPSDRASIPASRHTDSPPMSHCPTCEADLPVPNPTSCDRCGKRLTRTRPPETIKRHSKCPRCGHKNNAEVFLCTNCGEQVMSVERG